MTTASNLAPRAARGAAVVLLGQVMRTVILFVSTIVLSRLLVPGDFGLMAIAISLLALGEILRDSGLGVASIRGAHLSQSQKSNLFWINLGLGLAVGLTLFGIASWIGQIFNEPVLSQMLQWLSLCMPLAGFATQFRSELNRNLRFVSLTITDTVSALLGLAAAIIWAVNAPNIWSLVAQQLVTAMVGAILSAALARWRPGLPRRVPMGDFLRFGAGLLGTQVLAFFSKNADNFFIGLTWGPSSLGYYSRAYQLLMAPLSQLLAPLTRVAVPVMSRTGQDVRLFNSRLLSAQSIAGVPMAILYAFCFGAASPIVLLLLGAQWEPTIPIFQALCVGGVFRALNQATYWTFLATSSTRSLFNSYLVTQPLIVVSMLGGLPWGAIGVAWGHSLGYAFMWIVSAIWCSRTTILDLQALLKQAAIALFYFVVPIGLIAWISTQLSSSDLTQLAVAVLSMLVWVCITLLSSSVRQMARECRRMVLMLARKDVK